MAPAAMVPAILKPTRELKDVLLNGEVQLGHRKLVMELMENSALMGEIGTRMLTMDGSWAPSATWWDELKLKKV